ncbi:hypothetical protein PORY_001689 [Pneumocystis oryctolagi]|uniref:Uncharacterized protein n=1 Tax=Pneumocystis oryctolagi TaxID=42067 RepID=A0ACB7CHW0_9ASCO|nr:hypothetical protein PORY_001689 [Pneumocystis oryctolagi]
MSCDCLSLLEAMIRVCFVCIYKGMLEMIKKSLEKKASKMSGLDDWQHLKKLAMELSVLTKSVCCECSVCEYRLAQWSKEQQSQQPQQQQMSVPSYIIEEPLQILNQGTNPLLNKYYPSLMDQQSSGPQQNMFLESLSSSYREPVHVADVKYNNTQNTSYERLFETVNNILDRSSTESSILLAQNAWCQDISLYNVWNNIQESRAASTQLLVRSLSSESSASLAEAIATASPAGRRFRKDVQQLLEKVFQCKPWPNPTEKTILARRCGLTVRQEICS